MVSVLHVFSLEKGRCRGRTCSDNLISTYMYMYSNTASVQLHDIIGNSRYFSADTPMATVGLMHSWSIASMAVD